MTIGVVTAAAAAAAASSFTVLLMSPQRRPPMTVGVLAAAAAAAAASTTALLVDSVHLLLTVRQHHPQRRPLKEKKHPPLASLNFEFRGYSVWLELEQVNGGDIDQALDVASRDLHVHRIPAPHVTVEYGMNHLGSEQEYLDRFDQLCCGRGGARVGQKDSEDGHDAAASEIGELTTWPSFQVKGIHTDVSYDGVEDDDMDMAWIEMTLGTSKEHRNHVDRVLRAFYRSDADDDHHLNSSLQLQHPRPKWKPHLSLVYENPDQAKLNLHYSMTIMNKLPSLTSKMNRRVTAISLWKTEGKMQHWKQLRRYPLNR